MTLELHHINILTSDVEESVAFYREKLGMQLTSRFYREGLFDIALLRDGPASTPFAIGLVGPPFTPWMEDLYKKHGPLLDHYSFLVDDLGAWHGKLQAAGVEILAPPKPLPTAETLYFRDPCGVVVAMMARGADSPAAQAPAEGAPHGGYRLNHISMLCRDLGAVERFYLETLGLVTVYDRREVGFVLVADPLFLADADCEAPTLEIMGPEAYWEREQTFLAEHGPGLDHICFVVDDVDAAYEELRSKGVEFFLDPEDMGTNRLAWFMDPNGVQVELMLSMPRTRMLK